MKQICSQKTWQGSNTISMLQDCVDAINPTVLHKMEGVMSKGGCQESQKVMTEKEQKQQE